LKTLNNEIEQILVDIYNSHINVGSVSSTGSAGTKFDISKYERHINSLIMRTENNSYTHYLLEVLIEKIHERIRVINTNNFRIISLIILLNYLHLLEI